MRFQAQLSSVSVLAFVAAGVLVVGHVRAGPLPVSFACNKDGQPCNKVPACPTVSGECDSCTATATHEECKSSTSLTVCVGEPLLPYGCGTVRNGVCGADNVCVYSASELRCGRTKCRTQ